MVGGRGRGEKGLRKFVRFLNMRSNCVHLHMCRWEVRKSFRRSERWSREGTEPGINSLGGGGMQSTGGRVDFGLQGERQHVDAGVCVGLVVGDQGFPVRGTYFSRDDYKRET